MACRAGRAAADNAADVAFVGPGQGGELDVTAASPLRVSIPGDAFAADTVAILLAASPPPHMASLRLPVGAYARLLLVDRATALPASAQQPLALAAAAGDAETALRLYTWDAAAAQWVELAAGAAGAAVAGSATAGGLFALAVIGDGVFLPLIER